MNRLHKLVLSLGITTFLAITGCKEQSQTKKEATSSESINEVISYQEFKSKVYQEKDSGVFILNGDEVIEGENQLFEYYQQNVAQKPGTERGKSHAIVHQSNGIDQLWNNTQKKNLTYCVSDNFGERKADVVASMYNASKSWSRAADVTFKYLPEHDASCDTSNLNVLFDVRLTSNMPTHARSFFPNSSRTARSLLINEKFFRSDYPTLTGLLTHELGHILGLKHEFTRPEAGACFEDNNWRALTPYDEASVMHYPFCGITDRQLELSDYDRQGIAALYNHPYDSVYNNNYATFAVDATADNNEWYHYKLNVKNNYTIKASLAGITNTILYITLGAVPLNGVNYTCRSHTSFGSAKCEVNTGNHEYAYVSVQNVSSKSSNFKLTVKFPPTVTRTAEISAFGSLEFGESHHLWLSATKHSTITATTSVNSYSNVDLFTRNDAIPTRATNDCSSTEGTGITENCTVSAVTSQLTYISNEGARKSVDNNFITTINWFYKH